MGQLTTNAPRIPRGLPAALRMNFPNMVPILRDPPTERSPLRPRNDLPTPGIQP